MQPEPNSADILGTDAAVTTREEDEFNRYPFAKRIAETIKRHQSPHSLVLSIWGKWGSGKTSVLNFIVEELKESEVITMVFNPWMFSGEEQLLLGFFGQLSEVVSKLKSGAEAVDVLAAFSEKVIAQLAFFRPEATESQVQSIKSAASLESFKLQLSELLRLSGKRILILIDDLDRLDKQEIQAILRLVKLTGDFQYTTYLLAFDEAMVARAVGERYPGGGKAAGRRFLEKIIQVPLQLPVIQKEAMLKYFERRLWNCLLLTNTQLNDAEKTRLTSTLLNSVLQLDFTPRDVSRYTNTLLVVIPLLQAEANIVDLMLLEALKAFFPSAYRLAAAHKSPLTGVAEHNQLEGLHKRYDPVFGEQAANLGNARPIFFTLFPAFRKLYSERRSSFIFGQSFSTEEDLYKVKSIASSYYFKRYFSYAVQDGEIPDSTLLDFKKTLLEGQVMQAHAIALEMIARSNESEFLRLLESYHSEIQKQEAANYCRLLIQISHRMSVETLSQRQLRVVTRTSGLILSYLQEVNDEQTQFELSEQIISESSLALSYNLLFDIYRIKKFHSELEDFASISAFFNAERYKRLATILIDRSLTASQGEPLYTKFESASTFLFMTFKEAYGTSAIESYIKPIFEKGPEELTIFLRFLAPLGYLNGVPKHGHLDQDTYKTLADLFDVEYLYLVARKLLSDTPLQPYRPDHFQPPSDSERLHEFVHLHDNQTEDGLTDAVEVVEY